MKIALVVQGRFHAFDLGKALLSRGHDVTFFTNYPKWAARRFGVPEARVRSFWIEGILAKAGEGIRRWTGVQPERWLNPLFGRWAAGRIARERWDVIHTWSGVSEEVYRQEHSGRSLRMVMRGSAHIRVQDSILEEEERRTGARLDRPGAWIQAREQREYDLADRIVVLSTFAYNSFVAQGVPADKLSLLSLGADAAMFRSQSHEVEARCQRILKGEPLRVLFVGTMSLRKGLWDSEKIVRALHERVQFRFIGPVTPDGQPIVDRMRGIAQFVSKQPHLQLANWYSESDVFIFPTIEDGFAVVLAQALSSGLPVLTTPNCSGPDIVVEGQTGWIIPIRDPEAFIERLIWCDANREALAAMVRRVSTQQRHRDWDDVAADFEMLCDDALNQPSRRVAAHG